MFNNSKITSSINCIEKALKNKLKNYYSIKDDKITEKILKIHGINKENFDFITNIEKVIEEELNYVSIDDNSNKNEKSVEGIFSEVSAPIKKIIGYRYLYREMKNLYGKDEANKLSSEMYDYSIAISDSTKLLIPYCWAFDGSKIVTMGRPFGQLKSSAPKRISSYVAALCETIHQMSSHLAGAIAIGTFFLDIAHIILYKEKKTLNDIQKNTEYRKNIENEFQQFVHSVNHLSRNGIESPFTNLSIFDNIKLSNLLNQDNYAWYFESIMKDDGTFDEDYKKYIINVIMELQKIFLDFFNEGDPTKGGIPYRFPIVTLNISKKSTDKIEDDEFINNITKLDISRFNIYVSEGNKVSSCCRLLSDLDMINLAGQVNSFGGGSSISLGSHRVVTINLNRIALECKSIDNYYEIFNKRIENTARILYAHKQLLRKTVDKKLQLFMKNKWIDIEKLFSTFGMLGGYEAVKTLNKKFKITNKDLLKDILIFFNDKVKEYSKKYKIIGNIEQIPAESMAVRLCNVDKLLFKDKVPFELYSNQFIPLWENETLWKRMEEDGKYNKLLTGGGIVHFTIGEKVTSKQAKNIIKYAIEAGCEHFALNTIYSECENEHVMLGKYSICPKCSKKIKEQYSRVVGFFVPISSWNKTRKEWEFNKRVVALNGDLDKPKS